MEVFPLILTLFHSLVIIRSTLQFELPILAMLIWPSVVVLTLKEQLCIIPHRVIFLAQKQRSLFSFGSNVTSQPVSSSLADRDKVNYSVKVISPHTTEGLQLKKWETQIEKFSDLEAIKVGLSVDFNNYIRDCDFKFGYIQPGHGSKGR